jgi:hypothetical protein
LLARAHMPLKYWDEAFLAATYLINSLPTKVLQFSSPLECLFQEKPNYSVLRTFAYACWSNFRPFNTHKLQFHSKQYVFLGYSNIHIGFKCLDVAEGRVYISHDVVFDETVFPFIKLNPNAGTRLRSEILLLPSASQPNIVPSHGVELLDKQYANVHVNPVATNSVGSPVDSEKISTQFGASIQQETCLQGASSSHGSRAVIEANFVCSPNPVVDPVCILNPKADAADTPEPVPGVDSSATPTRAWDALPVKHVSPFAATRGQDASSAGHVTPIAWDFRSSVPGSSRLPTEDPTSGVSGAVAPLGSAASPAKN